VSTDAQGRYSFESSFPGIYGGAPPHVHVQVQADGHEKIELEILPSGRHDRDARLRPAQERRLGAQRGRIHGRGTNSPPGRPGIGRAAGPPMSSRSRCASRGA